MATPFKTTHDIPAGAGLLLASGQRERGKSQRKLRILQVASDEFKEHGFEKSRIDEIARRAKVATGTVYNYFPTKELLLLELVAYHREHSPKALVHLLSNPPPDPIDAFVTFYRIMGEESLRYLDKPLWRHALAAFTVGSWHEMNEKRWQHESELISYQISIVRQLQHGGSLPASLDASMAVEIIHSCGFFWWSQFLVKDDFTFAMFIEKILENVTFLFTTVLSAHAAPASERGQ